MCYFISGSYRKETDVATFSHMPMQNCFLYYILKSAIKYAVNCSKVRRASLIIFFILVCNLTLASSLNFNLLLFILAL